MDSKQKEIAMVVVICAIILAYGTYHYFRNKTVIQDEVNIVVLEKSIDKDTYDCVSYDNLDPNYTPKEPFKKFI